MSTKDIFGTELPSDDESDDEDYVSENEGSSDDEMDIGDQDGRSGGDFRTDIRRHKISKIFQEMKKSIETQIQSEDHSDQSIDPLMLEFQKPRREERKKSTDYVLDEIRKFSNVSTIAASPIDVKKYKALARSEQVSAGSSTNALEAVQKALSGLEGSKVEVEEEVRFAGEVVRLKKLVERTSSHAAKFERKKRAIEDSSSAFGGSLGGLQSYLNQIKSRRAVTSVEKSATDWNQVKLSTEGLEQSLKADRGFLDKQAFLVKADLKEDEMKRDARRRRLLEQPTGFNH